MGMPQQQRTVFTAKPRTAKIPISEVQTQRQTELPELLEEAHEIIYSVAATFPFQLFPDKLVIRPNHIDIIHGIFFGTGSTQRIQITDIREVTAHYNPIFGTLEIFAGPPEYTATIPFLKKSEAMQARRLLAALIECHAKNVDLTRYTRSQLIEYLSQIGTSRDTRN